MSRTRKIAYSAGGALLILAVVGLFLPPVAHIERRIQIHAPAASVFALINDFKRINEWSPWVATDPHARYTISGPPRGVGASIDWDGQIVGQGSQTIVESHPFDRVVSELNLGHGNAVATFRLQQADDVTDVTWSLDNDSGLNLIARYFGLMLDRIAGANYELGLENLKTMAERLPNADFADLDIEFRNVEAMEIAYLSTSSAPQPGAISKALGNAYFRVLGFMDKHKLQQAGAPMSVSGSFNGSRLLFDAAIPIRGLGEEMPADRNGVQIRHSYEGPVIRFNHIGSYRSLGQTHDKIAAYLSALGIKQNGQYWESYISDPSLVDEEELTTHIFYPILVDSTSP